MRIERLGAVEEREVAERAGSDGADRGAVTAERRAEHPDALAVVAHPKDDTHESEAAHSLSADGGGRGRDAGSNEGRHQRLDHVAVHDVPGALLEHEGREEEGLRVGVGGAHILDERVGAGENRGGGVGRGVVARLHHRHERTFPSTVATLGVGGHHTAHVEVALVRSLGRGAELGVAQRGGALPRRRVGHVHQVEEREELPGDKLGTLARVLGDEVEQVAGVDREHPL